MSGEQLVGCFLGQWAVDDGEVVELVCRVGDTSSPTRAASVSSRSSTSESMKI